jgi:hypothetical protein
VGQKDDRCYYKQTSGYDICDIDVHTILLFLPNAQGEPDEGLGGNGGRLPGVASGDLFGAFFQRHMVIPIRLMSSGAAIANPY